MDGITFNTLRYANRLIKGGFTREQAEAMAEANTDAFSETIANRQLATKHDLDNAQHQILKWMMAMIIGQTTLLLTALGIIFALLK